MSLLASAAIGWRAQLLSVGRLIFCISIHHHMCVWWTFAWEGLRIGFIAINFNAMAAKRLNVICCGEKCVLRYFPGTETAALVHAVTARFRLGHSSFYLSEPALDDVVPLSSTLPDDFTVIVHAVNISAPALAWDRDAIKESVNAVDDVMDCETEEEVIWPGSEESQEHEDEDEEDVEKEEEDKDMQQKCKNRTFSLTFAGHGLFFHPSSSVSATFPLCLFR